MNDTSDTQSNADFRNDSRRAPDRLAPGDLGFTPPALANDLLAAFLEEQYGVTGEFKPLAGERDQNIRVRDAQGNEFVYKISSPDEEDALVDFQICALEHLRRTDPGLPVPRHIRTLGGELRAELTEPGGVPHAVRLLSYLPGTPLLAVGQPSLETLFDLGALQGGMCAALADFTHPAACHFMPWDTMNGLVVSNSLCTYYLPDHLVDRCRPVLDHLKYKALPAMEKLPAQVIHNDAHSGNVLVDPGQPECITGLIDFGDMVHRPLLIDLATSLASMVERHPDYLAAVRALVAGFESRMPLSEVQCELLYDALIARQLLTVQLLTFRVMHTDCAPDIREQGLPDSVMGLERTLDITRGEFLAAISR